MNVQIVFTKRGLEDKQKEYNDLLLQRPDAVKELSRARDMGDLSENGYYKAARMKLSDVDRKLRQLKHLLKIAIVQDKTQTEFIEVGSTVVLQTENKTFTYTIVGTYEANPHDGKLSASSPLGKLLVGKKKGENVTLSHNNKTYTIKSVS